jgi:uncharacterized protein
MLMPLLSLLLRAMRVCQVLAALSLMAFIAPVQAQQEVPALTAHVIDKTATLSAAQVQALESKLTTFEQARGAQIVVLLVPTTQPEDISSYANRVANTWKVGRREIGDGLLIVVAKNDRTLRIEVAKTLEGAIPDLMAKRVIDGAITPGFKSGDFAGGLEAGTDQIMKLITGESLPAPTAQGRGNEGGFQWMDLMVFAFIAVPVVAAITRNIFGPKLGPLATGGAVGGIALLITSSLLIGGLAAMAALLFALFSNVSGSSGPGGRGGFSGGGGWGTGGRSGGGGGFSSGGGGDFGGGGASGRW